MNNHVRIVAYLHIAFGALSLLAAIVTFIALGAVGGLVVVQGEIGAAGILGVVAVFVAGLLSVLAIPDLLGGWALLVGKPWGRPLVIVISFLSLLNIPFGTVVGIYSLWALLRKA
ncbi:hypothetical protein [Pelagicoccus mobilis]|uniref:Uncharacterized protein n=1 Tax=Pelagicoccus mobilis TaxID=415221 RepID=A0A934RZK2_9BACT|nr:hypothetical protein [Pelagicoccus mobilis]MBK1876378.1 hypothetical protein [Pelagicoccus mobilis]